MFSFKFLTLCSLRSFRSYWYNKSFHRSLCSARETSLITPSEKYITLSINDVLSKPEIGLRIDIKGWVCKKRKLKTMTFLEISDGISHNTLQIILSAELIFKNSISVDYGSSIHCQGTIQSSIGPKQPIEVHVDRVLNIGDCLPSDFPFSYKERTSEDWKQLRRHLHLRPKVEKYKALIRLRSKINHCIHNIMNELGFIYITAPLLTTNDCEGGCEVFNVVTKETEENKPFFCESTMLTVSSQLHLEVMASAIKRVYTITPAFRAENSRSRKHLSEFTLFEAEEAFIDDLDTLMDRAEYIFHEILNRVYVQIDTDLDYILKFNKYTLIEMLTKKFFRITYDEAIYLINNKQNLYPMEYGQDFTPYYEKIILDYFENIPVFITHFPAYIKPFYMKRDSNKALGFDLICPVGGEICGGGLREDNYKILSERLKEIGTFEKLQWYSELRKFGNTPHGGFGFGFDRIIQCITGLTSIKDVVPFPRWAHNCKL